MSGDEALLLAAIRAASSEWIFSFEGGGSKTTLQVISKKTFRVHCLRRTGSEDDLTLIQGDGSNPNTVGEEGVLKVLRSLIEDAFLVCDDKSLVALGSLTSTSCAIAGMAGVGENTAQQIVLRCFAGVGFTSDRVGLLTDAALTLQLVNSDHGGAILIAGTGSVCFARRPVPQQATDLAEAKGARPADTVRVGGLGRLIGDKGSGYYVAITAIRKGLEHEYGYGKPTQLVEALRNWFQVPQLTALIPVVHNGTLSAQKVASACGVVFEAARLGDEVAKHIVSRAASHLSTLIAHALSLIFPPCEVCASGLSTLPTFAATSTCPSALSSSFLVYVTGGMFASPDSAAFIQQILDAPPVAQLLKRCCAQCPQQQTPDDGEDKSEPPTEPRAKRQKPSEHGTCCCFPARPLFVNTSGPTPVSSAAILEVLRRQSISTHAELAFDPECLRRLSSLPLVLGPGLRSEAQRQQSRLGGLTTEQFHPVTAKLSKKFKKDITRALKLLYEADRGVEMGMYHFRNLPITNDFCQALAASLSKGDAGRVILVGSGSSGRLGVELAAWWARWTSHMNNVGKVVAVMAGGALAFVRAKEGCEDSEEAGAAAMGPQSAGGVGITDRDCVVLISASGSAKYNNGVGRAAAKAGAKVFYFFNSAPPPYTAAFIKECGVHPVHVDVGPMAITGSTRLQAATVALVCLGAALQVALDIITIPDAPPDIQNVVKLVHTGLCVANASVEKYYRSLAELIRAEVAVFSDPSANFYESVDKRRSGYVTYLASSASIREVMVDTSETSPTFSTNPPRMVHEWRKKKAELRAYLVPSPETASNEQGWEAMLYRKLEPLEQTECAGLLLSTSPNTATNELNGGFGGFQARPIGAGNLVVGVIKLVGGDCVDGDGESAILRLAALFQEVHRQGGKTALIWMWGLRECEVQSEYFRSLLKNLKAEADLVIPMEVWFPVPVEMPFSAAIVSLMTTTMLKQILNYVSNGAMIGMGKVLGNIMVDVSPSNNKLVDRGVRIIQRLLELPVPASAVAEEQVYNLLYEFVVRAFTFKQLMEAQYGTLVPPPIPMVVTMLGGLLSESDSTPSCDVDEACRKIVKSRQLMNNTADQ